MYITPNGIIYLLSGIPLDETYNNTLFFNSKSAQFNEFIGYAIKTCTALSYMRCENGNGKIKVPFSSDSIYMCNYIVYKNNGFSDRYFYAFVNSINYINNNCCEIEFSLDIMQSFITDITLLKCLVVREHSKTDEYYENLTSEKVNTSEYLKNKSVYTDGDSIAQSLSLFPLKIAVCYSADNENQCGYIGNTLTGCTVKSFSNPDGVKNLIASLGAQAPDRIVSISMFPSWADPSVSPNPALAIRNQSFEFPKTIDGYKPRNKKLLNFPYCKLCIKTPSGQSVDIMPQYLATPFEFTFQVRCNMAGNPSIYLIPTGYKNGKGLVNIDDIVGIEKYAMCAFTYSSYNQWLAYNSGSFWSGVVNDIVDTATNSAIAAKTMGGPIAGVVGGSNAVKAISSNVGEYYDATKQPNKVKGTMDGAGLCGVGLQCFEISYETIPKWLAELYDDFFDRFGYNCGKIKVPNVSSRPVWNYVKTDGCNIEGRLPAEICATICGVFDSGVTFWKHIAQIGNYSLNNEV